jgi:cytochrome c biogenesis protein CcdA
MWAFVLAALAGVATILSPCVLPMLPHRGADPGSVGRALNPVG